jgi:mono/diheme cytochrome c family protein
MGTIGGSWPKVSCFVGCMAVVTACGGDGPAGGESGGESGGSTGTGGVVSTGPGEEPTGTGDAAETGSGGGSAEGSSSGGETQPAACAMGFPIAATEQVKGDAEAGYYALLNEGYVTCGIPYTLFPLAKPFLGAFAADPPLPGRTGKNAKVPYNWTVHTSKSSGAEIVSLNCLECHAGRFNGELMLGLGKADADYTESIGGALAKIPVPGIPIPGLEELTRMAQRYQAIGDYVKMLTVGTNPADTLAAVLSTHRDKDTLEWLDEPHTPVPTEILPVDTPPWWHTKKKHGLFWNGMSRGDHRATMIYATSLCTDSVAEAEGILTYFNNINAFIESIEAPKYPFPIDAALAAEGAGVFAENCSCCHGTLRGGPGRRDLPEPAAAAGDDRDRPAAGLRGRRAAVRRVVQRVVVRADRGADDRRSDAGLRGAAARRDLGERAVSAQCIGADDRAGARQQQAAAVVAPGRLRQHALRPERGRLAVAELPYGQAGAPDDERKHVYDTTLQGHWNTGHTFGDHLSEQERRAVLEYLKTL